MSRLVFPKKHRLLVPSDYQRVFKQGCRQRGGLFSLNVCANGENCARLGLAIAKRYIPLSVERNRIRRVVRESFRHYQSHLKGKDIVISARGALHELSNASLNEELVRQWKLLVGL